jgi:hypothetical protein
MRVLCCRFKADFITEAQFHDYRLQAYLHTYGMKINSIDQRFSTGARQHNGVTRKVLRCAEGVWGKVEKKRENFEEYKNRRNI